MKTLAIRTVAVLPVMLLFLAFNTGPDNSAWATPFVMRIVDQETGEGISHARLISDNGIVCFTRADGSVLWTESALMDRDVSFRIETPAGQRTVTVRVKPNGHAVVQMAR
jgi:hypothetical protein